MRDVRDGGGISLREVFMPKGNCVEEAAIAALDRQKALGFRCALAHLVACKIAGRPGLQRLLADYAMQRQPGGPDSALKGCTADALSKARTRLIAEIVEATRLLAEQQQDSYTKSVMLRLVQAMMTCLPQTGTATPGSVDLAGGSNESSSTDCSLSAHDMLTAWVELLRSGGVSEADFLIPSTKSDR